MRIIKNFALNSSKIICKIDFSINCMAISNDLEFLAIGDSEKLISVYQYKNLEGILKSLQYNLNSEKKFNIFSSSINNNLSKMILDHHTQGINSLAFTKVNKYHLISGGSDKCIIIWKLNEEKLTSEKIRLLNCTSDVNDIVILPNDEYILSGCVDCKIYFWKCNFEQKNFELIGMIDSHSNYITSICLELTSIKENYFKFCSYSEDAHLIITEVTIEGKNLKFKIIKDFEEFVNIKNKINNLSKKIE